MRTNIQENLQRKSLLRHTYALCEQAFVPQQDVRHIHATKTLWQMHNLLLRLQSALSPRQICLTLEVPLSFASISHAILAHYSNHLIDLVAQLTTGGSNRVLLPPVSLLGCTHLGTRTWQCRRTIR